MKYALGNMLNGAGGLNPDGLSLDLQFATDKTLTARKGPTPGFTRASTATFIGSDGLIQSAAINAARFDHNPATLVSRGLLIEESRTNNFTRSDDFGQAVWTKQAVTVTSDNTTSPDGTGNSDSVFETVAVGAHDVYFASSSLTDATTSIFVKPNGRSNVNIRFYSAINNWVTTTFLLSGAGSITQTSSGSSSTYTARSQTITQLSNGWYRCTLSAGKVGGVNFASFSLSTTSTPTFLTDGTESYAGNASLGVHLWGAQLEAGSFPTSYIPTTTGPLARSRDICDITSIASFYGNGVGTILVGSQLNVATMLNGLCGFFTGTNQIVINRLANNTRAATNGNAPNLTINSGTLASTLFVKSAFAFNTNDGSFANNGVSAGTSASVGIPSVSNFGIGTNGTQTVQSGTISEIKVFKKRLANAKLLTITT